VTFRQRQPPKEPPPSDIPAEPPDEHQSPSPTPEGTVYPSASIGSGRCEENAIGSRGPVSIRDPSVSHEATVIGDLDPVSNRKPPTNFEEGMGSIRAKDHAILGVSSSPLGSSISPGPHSMTSMVSSSCVLDTSTVDTDLNVAYANSVRDRLQIEYANCSLETDRSLQDSFDKLNIDRVHPYPNSTVVDGITRPVLNMSLATSLGELLTKGDLSLEELVRLVRNQHSHDPRPNKRLDPAMIDYLYHGTVHHNLMVRIAQEGFNPGFCHPEPIQRDSPDNHRSATTNIDAVAKFIRAGQDDGSLLVLPASFMSTWRHDPRFRFHTSPMGVVPKKNEVTATNGRVILDLSWPRNQSLNDYTIRQSVPVTEWAPAATVGRRIHQLSIESGWNAQYPHQSTMYALVGDVNAAFRNIPNHEKHVKWFGFYVPELDVIAFDMSAPFGWTASPMYYGVFGNGISFLVRRESPHDMNPHLSSDSERFFCYEWVDDYILIERDTPGRLSAAETALRLAMTLTLGPTAIHPRKFAEKWEQSVHYLGLDWCLRSCSVSMPTIKIEKALGRVEALLSSQTVTRQQLQKLVGSLRHVSTCIPAARPYYQRLQSACRIPRGSKCAVSVGLKADCEWFKEILHQGHLQSIPVSLFANISDPDIHLYMDACDYGLVVLNLANNEFIHVVFDPVEREAILRIKARTAIPKRFHPRRLHTLPPPKGSPPPPEGNPSTDFSINVREFLSIALAMLIWGPSWETTGKFFHVKAWIDNSAAVSWCNKLASPNAYGQQLLRKMGLVMARHRIHLSANHMPGVCNHMADAGSRSSSCPQSAQIWSSFSNSWSRRQVPIHLRHCYRDDSPVSSSPRWPQPPDEATRPPGQDGTTGATPTTIRPSSTERPNLSRASSSSLPASCSTTPPHPTAAHRSSPRSALSIGVIRPFSATLSACPHVIASPLAAWLALGPQPASLRQSTQPSSGHSTAPPFGTLTSETTRFGAAWFSPSSSACALANTLAHRPRPNTTSVFRMSPSPTDTADQPLTVKKPKPFTCSSGAVKRTRPTEAAPGASTALVTSPAVRSSLRGACGLLASRWARKPKIHSAPTPIPEAHADRYRSPSSPQQSRKRPRLMDYRVPSSLPIHSEAEEPPRCFSGAAATPRFSSSVDGNRMPTRHTSA